MERWHAERCAYHGGMLNTDEIIWEWASTCGWVATTMGFLFVGTIPDGSSNDEPLDSLELGGVQVDRNKYPSLQHNAAQIKGNQKILPKPVVVKVEVNN
jgi:hypothetical protein